MLPILIGLIALGALVAFGGVAIADPNLESRLFDVEQVLIVHSGNLSSVENYTYTVVPQLTAVLEGHQKEFGDVKKDFKQVNKKIDRLQKQIKNTPTNVVQNTQDSDTTLEKRVKELEKQIRGLEASGVEIPAKIPVIAGHMCYIGMSSIEQHEDTNTKECAVLVHDDVPHIRGNNHWSGNGDHKISTYTDMSVFTGIAKWVGNVEADHGDVEEYVIVTDERGYSIYLELMKDTGTFYAYHIFTTPGTYTWYIESAPQVNGTIYAINGF